MESGLAGAIGSAGGLGLIFYPGRIESGCRTQAFAVENPKEEVPAMSEHVYKVIEVIGSSEASWEAAASQAIEQAGHTLKDLRIAEVVEQDIKIEEGKPIAFRTRLKLSFRLHPEM